MKGRAKQISAILFLVGVFLPIAIVVEWMSDKGFPGPNKVFQRILKT